MSYADHQEEVARALHNLLRARSTTLATEPAIVLACRDQALKAMRDRLSYLAGDPADVTNRPVVSVASLAQWPVQHLAQVVHALPRPPVPDLPPTQLLAGPNASAAATPVGQWRCVARNLLLGTAELARADQQPWVHRPEAGWRLVGDVACTLEAILILDEHLAANGALAGATEQRRITQRLVAGHTAKLARWFGTDATADRATAGVGSELGVGGAPPVRIVRDAVDYVTAQRTLTAVLHGQAGVLRPGSDQRPGLTAARALATGQIRLAQAFATWADDAADPDLATQFRSRIPIWRELHVSTARLAEIESRRSPLLLAQQSEMVIRLRSQFRTRLSRSQLHDLNAATHEVAVTVGRQLHHEAQRTQNIVALEYGDTGLPQSQPLTGPERAFTTACQHLVDDPTPVEPPRRPTAAHEREQLRKTLEGTAAGSAPSFRTTRPAVPERRLAPRSDRLPAL